MIKTMISKSVIGKIKGERLFCGLDIGSRTIKTCLVKYIEEHKPELLGVYEAKTSGFKDSSVSDLAELSECIHATIEGLTQKTGVKLKEVQLGIGGELIVKRFTSTVVPLLEKGSKVIASNDLKKVQTQARLLGMNMEEEIIHDIPQYYRVDDINTAINPLGLLGRKLEIKSLLVLANMTLIRNITKAVNQAGYDVASLFFTSFVSSQVLLDEKLRREGVALIDIGSRVTDILIFKDGLLKYLDNIAFGGDDFTRSIATQLNLTFDLAEDIKKSYAVALSSDIKEDEEILVKKESEYVPIKREVIFHCIDPVINQLVEVILNSLKASNLSDQLNTGIVMVGGGSLLPGLIERIEQSTNLLVRMGKLNCIAKNLNNTAMFSSVIGLAQGGFDKLAVFSMNSNGQEKNFVSRICNHIKEVYQEYF